MVRSGKGFTLIELIVTALIIGILAVIVAPVMQGPIRRAVKTEAMAALGTIRTATRAYYVEYGNYGLAGMISNPFNFTAHDLNPEDFDGYYYSSGCYFMSRLSSSVWINPSQSTGRPGSSQVNQSSGRIMINVETGVITDTTT